ncbi:GNAT family N-acetyltransferase [Nocardia fusca]|jgi:predicted GNAT family acetyltransferase|uniref:GNAT family N-acetyltransferase n=1 Tax=Nocardia fusca TaxID=941183 RepID=UPI0007A75B07|nr:GNAT family N-acetyltransferase [Nocardia fusca]
MTEATEQSKVVRNPGENRYEVWYGAELAGFAEYTERGGETVFTHTEIGPEFGGKGLGSRLAEFAISDTVDRGRRIRPECAFIRSYLEKHPQYNEHVVGGGE